MVAHDVTAYRRVLAQAKDLPAADKLRLMETLAAQLRDDIAVDKRHRVSEFRGIGRASWDGSDAQEYVNRERDAWDG